jgi:hypothetical protein
MQVVTYLHTRFHCFVSKARGDLAKVQDLEVAFEAALTHVERSLAGGMKTLNGDSPTRAMLVLTTLYIRPRPRAAATSRNNPGRR